MVHQISRPKAILVLASLLMILSGCQKAFEYSAGSQLLKIRPSEIYDIKVDQNRDALAAADGYLQARSYLHALTYYQAALKNDPNSAAATLGVASSYSLLGQFTQADQYFAKYKSNFGTNAAYYNDFGFSYMLRGNLPQAKQYLNKALALAPNSEAIKNNIAGLKMLEQSRKDAAA